MAARRGSHGSPGGYGSAEEMHSLLKEIEEEAADGRKESDEDDDDETHALLAEIGDEAARLHGCCHRVRSSDANGPKALASVPPTPILPVRPKSCSPEPARPTPDAGRKRVSWVAFCTSIYCLFRIMAWGVAFVIVITGLAIAGEAYPQWWHSRVPQSWEVLSEQYGLMDALNASQALAPRENVSNTSGYLAQLRQQMPVALEEAKHRLESVKSQLPASWDEARHQLVSLKSQMGFLENTTGAAASPRNASRSGAGASGGYWEWLRAKVPAAWTAAAGLAGRRNATNATASPPPGNASGGAI